MSQSANVFNPSLEARVAIAHVHNNLQTLTDSPTSQTFFRLLEETLFYPSPELIQEIAFYLFYLLKDNQLLLNAIDADLTSATLSGAKIATIFEALSSSTPTLQLKGLFPCLEKCTREEDFTIHFHRLSPKEQQLFDALNHVNVGTLPKWSDFVTHDGQPLIYENERGQKTNFLPSTIRRMQAIGETFLENPSVILEEDLSKPRPQREYIEFVLCFAHHLKFLPASKRKTFIETLFEKERAQPLSGDQTFLRTKEWSKFFLAYFFENTDSLCCFLVDQGMNNKDIQPRNQKTLAQTTAENLIGTRHVMLDQAVRNNLARQERDGRVTLLQPPPIVEFMKMQIPESAIPVRALPEQRSASPSRSGCSWCCCGKKEEEREPLVKAGDPTTYSMGPK